MNILIVTLDFPLPSTDGARSDMLGRIQALKELSHSIDIISTVKTIPDTKFLDEAKKLCENLTVVKRNPSIKNALSFLPYQVKSRVGLKKVQLSRPYDIVVLESEFVSEVLKNKSLSATNIAVRIHNDSPRGFNQLARSEKSILLSLFFRFEALRLKRYWKKIKQSFDYFWFISHDEYLRFIHKNPLLASKSLFIPPAINLVNMRTSARKKPQALFIGTIGLAPNMRAVEWYLKYVHEHLMDIHGYSFIIAGNTLGKSIDSIMKYAQLYSNIEIIENPSCLDNLYSEASVFVIPLFNGTGVKLKTIHAALEGLPIVSTSIGSEGTGFIDKQHYLCADTPEDFIAAVRQVLLDKECSEGLVRESQKLLKNCYNHVEILASALKRAAQGSSID